MPSRKMRSGTRAGHTCPAAFLVVEANIFAHRSFQDQIAGCRIVREGIAQLLRDPRGLAMDLATMARRIFCGFTHKPEVACSTFQQLTGPRTPITLKFNTPISLKFHRVFTHKAEVPPMCPRFAGPPTPPMSDLMSWQL